MARRLLAVVGLLLVCVLSAACEQESTMNVVVLDEKCVFVNHFESGESRESRLDLNDGEVDLSGKYCLVQEAQGDPGTDSITEAKAALKDAQKDR